MDQVWTTLIGILAGAIGYLVATFWFRPILRYRDIKYKVASDLVFYANAIELETLQGKRRQDTQNRQVSNRRCAADLAAIYCELPVCYKRWLEKRGEDPKVASAELIGLSNASERDEAKECIANVKKLLRLPLQRP